MLSVGDGHAMQGDGEVASLAVDLRITQLVNQTVGVRALWQEDRWTPTDRS